MPTVALNEMTALVTRAFENAGASAAMACSAADHLIAAEAQGLSSHGLSRTPL